MAQTDSNTSRPKFKHLLLTDRVLLAFMLNEGYSQTRIAQEPDVNRSSVSREIRRDGSQLLFRVIADSYETKSLILTTNLEFSKWGGIFTDNQMAAAMIDRLVHPGHLVLFEGQSYRMTHALMRQKS